MFPALPAQLPSLLAHVSVSPSFDAHVFIYENTQTHKQMRTTIQRSSLQKPVFPACFPSKQEKEEPVQCSLQAVRATFVFFSKIGGLVTLVTPMQKKGKKNSPENAEKVNALLTDPLRNPPSGLCL